MNVHVQYRVPRLYYLATPAFILLDYFGGVLPFARLGRPLYKTFTAGFRKFVVANVTSTASRWGQGPTSGPASEIPATRPGLFSCCKSSGGGCQGWGLWYDDRWPQVFGMQSHGRSSMSETATGILKRVNKDQYSLRTGDRSYRTGPLMASVSPDLVRRFGLVEGAMVTGQVDVRKGKRLLVSVETAGGLPPEEFRRRPRFTDLVAVDPYDRFNLGACKQESMRIVDLISPIGKGTRQLIV